MIFLILFVYLLFFYVQNGQLEFTEFMIKSCLINKHCNQTTARVLLHAVEYNAYKDMFGNAKPKHTHTHIKHTTNKVVE